ncbi:hypothetical protein Glove_169g46 [Diversispora epigaea]|uniref:Uncharacterized protein n=1 Tax=Diversispora epigaea TaxID=1348612 RepID=A0A397IPC7_9GLOM|nr:hypothetical protein Glove_169g46 [Diversispora epigaea]
MNYLIIENTIRKENVTFYQYSEFENVKLISKNIFALNCCVHLNDDFTLNNLINEIQKYRKLEIYDGITKPVVKNLSEINVSGTSVEFETSPSHSINVIKNLNTKNEDVSVEISKSIKNSSLIYLKNKAKITIKDYFREGITTFIDNQMDSLVEEYLL